MTPTSPGHSQDAAMSAAGCDVCGALLSRGERRRLVWNSGPGGDLVLAELCARCASQPDRLLERYGGRGRDALRITQETSAAVVEPAPMRRAGDMIVRALVYVLIALATFFVVTLVTSRL